MPYFSRIPLPWSLLLFQLNDLGINGARCTPCYMWSYVQAGGRQAPDIGPLPPGHPCAGHLSPGGFPLPLPKMWVEAGPPDFPLHCSDEGDSVRVPKASAMGSLLP